MLTHFQGAMILPSCTRCGNRSCHPAYLAQEGVVVAACQHSDAWLDPPGASEAKLKKRTLTNLYNARPTWLDHVHKGLDAAVLAAYGWPADLDDENILARLLALNLERVT